MAAEPGLLEAGITLSLTQHILGLSSLWLHLWLPPGLLTVLDRRGKNEKRVLNGSIALPCDLLPAHPTVKVECFSSTLRVSQKLICLSLWGLALVHRLQLQQSIPEPGMGLQLPPLQRRLEQVNVVPLSSAGHQHREPSPTLTAEMTWCCSKGHGCDYEMLSLQINQPGLRPRCQSYTRRCTVALEDCQGRKDREQRSWVIRKPVPI